MKFLRSEYLVLVLFPIVLIVGFSVDKQTPTETMFSPWLLFLPFSSFVAFLGAIYFLLRIVAESYERVSYLIDFLVGYTIFFTLMALMFFILPDKSQAWISIFDALFLYGGSLYLLCQITAFILLIYITIKKYFINRI